MAREQQRPRAKRSGAEMARADGREAHGRGAARDDVPSGYRATKGLGEAWVDGWDEAARTAQAARVASVTVQEPVVVTQTVDSTVRWPDDKPLPTHYEDRRYACPDCRAVVLPNGLQAVTVSTGRADGRIKVLYARCCDRYFKLPVRVS